MKKLFAILVALVLVSSFVFAAQGDTETGKPEVTTTAADAVETGSGQGSQGEPEAMVQGENGQGEMAQEGETVMAREKEQLGEAQKAQLREKVKGLDNALTNVKNENARQRLEANLVKFQEKVQARLERMENVEVEEIDEETGAITMKAEEPVKYFGFIKGKATKRFEIDAKGNVNERAPWYSMFYSEIAVEETTE